MQKQKKIISGIPGLDEIFLGGMHSQRCYRIYGDTGTGKTIFSIQWLLEGLRRGEKCLYVTLLEQSRCIKADVKNFGWNLDDLEILDLTPNLNDIQSNLDEYTVFTAIEVEKVNVWQMIYNKIMELKPHRVVIDCATQLRYASTDTFQFRKHILNLVTFLNLKKITSFLVQEPKELSQDPSVSFIVDASIFLHNDVSHNRMTALRMLSVEKNRGANSMVGPHQFIIDDNGITIFPHVLEELGNPLMQKECIPSGIIQLDEMLYGGIQAGSTTIISGPSGSGKTTIGLTYLRNSAAQGMPVILFTFEETINSIKYRFSEIGLPLEDLLKNKSLRIVHINSKELYPDQFLEMIRAVVQEGFKMLMIDSISGYLRAMGAYPNLMDQIHNLINYLTRKEITTFLLESADRKMEQLNLSYPELSSSIDNIILLRFAIQKGEIIKMIGCLKMRKGNFHPTFKRLSITQTGLSIQE